MRVEVIALRSMDCVQGALELLREEGPFELHAIHDGAPLVPKREALTLVIDGLESLCAADLDALRVAVNEFEVQGYERIVFIAALDKHHGFSKAVRWRIHAIQRDVRIRKIFSKRNIHYDLVVFSPYIFIETGFKRASQPVFVLAMLENRRRIHVLPERRDDLDHIRQLVVEHDQSYQGHLELWGRVECYRYHNGRGRVYQVWPDGRLLEKSGPGGAREGCAALSVGIHL